MMLDLFGPRQKSDSTQIAQVKQWVADIFQLPEEQTVMVTELRCSEPGCPPLETVIAIMGEQSGQRQYKLHKAAGDVTYDDIARLRNGETITLEDPSN